MSYNQKWQFRSGERMPRREKITSHGDTSLHLAAVAELRRLTFTPGQGSMSGDDYEKLLDQWIDDNGPLLATRQAMLEKVQHLQ